ncbi:hypothetical protein AB0F15_30795 [Amycolatopsis sp. NPDC026612]
MIRKSFPAPGEHEPPGRPFRSRAVVLTVVLWAAEVVGQALLEAESFRRP